MIAYVVTCLRGLLKVPVILCLASHSLILEFLISSVPNEEGFKWRSAFAQHYNTSKHLFNISYVPDTVLNTNT